MPNPQSVRPIAIDYDEGWSNRVRTLSSIFAAYPDVKTSGVELSTSEGGFSLVNSEAARCANRDGALVRARATGSLRRYDLRDSVAFHATVPTVAGEAEMRRGVTTLAENVVALAKAPQGETTAPVLFEGMAGRRCSREL
jgi:hypothetical protein